MEFGQTISKLNRMRKEMESLIETGFDLPVYWDFNVSRSLRILANIRRFYCPCLVI